MRAWLGRFFGFFGRNQRDRDLADELNTHLDAHIADNVRAGLTFDDARRDALLKLGGLAQAVEACRDRRSLPFVETTMQDLRYAWRTLRRSPGFTATAVAVIALGIGAATASFTILDYTMLRPLPFPEPDRLVRIYQSDIARGVPRLEASPPNFIDWRAGSASFSAMSSFLF